MEQSATIGKLALALSKAQATLDGANKSSNNPFFSSKYADLHECLSAAKEALAINELAVFQTTDADEKGIWVYTTIAHSSGEWARGRLLMKPKKNDDQSTGSSITYGRRYGFAAIVGLAQKDDDGNSNMESDKKTVATTITDDQINTIYAMMDDAELKADVRSNFLKYVGATTVEDIAADKYKAAISVLEAKIKSLVKA